MPLFIGRLSLGLCVLVAAFAHPASAAGDGAWLPTLNNGPPRDGLAYAMDTRRHELLMYGGRYPPIHFGPGSNSVTHDEGSLGALTDSGFVAALTSAPGVRENAAAAYDRNTDRFYMFGGDSVIVLWQGGYRYYPMPLADLWYADRSAGGAWHQVPQQDGGPGPRLGASLIVDDANRRLLLFGGRDTLGNSFNQVWALPLDAAPVWTLLSTTGTPPTPRSFAHVVYDPVRGRMLVMGGQGVANPNAIMALSLSLSGTPTWSVLDVSGTPPVNAVSGLDYDPSRDALVAAVPALDVYRIPLGPTPQWVPLTLANPPSSSVPASLAVVGYDVANDMLLAPATSQFEAPSGSFLAIETWSSRIAFDRALAVSSVQAQFVDVLFDRGRMIQHWQVAVAGGTASPRLESSAGGAFQTAVVAPSDTTGGRWTFADPLAQPGDLRSYRLAWDDVQGAHNSDTVLVQSPPAPVDEPFQVDSAFVVVGQAHLRITLANDSLSWLVKPYLERRITGGSWTSFWPLWPDSSRRMTLRDTTLEHGVPYEYALAFLSAGQVVRQSIATLTDNAPVAVLAEQTPGVRSFHARWYAASAPGFTAVLEVQRDNGPWEPQQTLVQDATSLLEFTLWPLRLGSTYRARLAWLEQGVTRYSSIVTDVVPAAMATGRFAAHTDGVLGSWSVAPPDTGIVWRLDRATYAGGPWTVLAIVGTGGDSVVAYADHAVQAGTTYFYRLVAADGVGADTLAAGQASTLHRPTLFAKHATPQRLDFDWLVPDDGTYDLVLERDSQLNGFVPVAPLFAGTDRHVHYTTYSFQPGEALIFRIRWSEGDLALRYTAPDTTVLLQAVVDSLGASFGFTHVITHWNLHPVDSTFSVTLERSTDHDLFVFLKSFNSGVGPAFGYNDRDIMPGHEYAYRLSWVLGYSAPVSGAAAALPTSGFAASHVDRVRVGWTFPGLDSLAPPRAVTGTIDRRVPGGAWATIATVATSTDSLRYDDFTSPPGEPMEWRFTWLDLGDTLRTASVAATIPVVAATLASTEATPSRVMVRWQVTGDEPGFPMRVLRREASASTWDSLGLAVREAGGVRVYVDSTVAPGRPYVYRLTWSQGGTIHQSADDPVLVIGPTLLLGKPSPNPSRSAFSVGFSLPDSRPARLELFDLGGRTRMANDYAGPGTFRFALPAGQLEPGLYFLRLSGSGRKLTERVVIAP